MSRRSRTKINNRPSKDDIIIINSNNNENNKRDRSRQRNRNVKNDRSNISHYQLTKNNRKAMERQYANIRTSVPLITDYGEIIFLCQEMIKITDVNIKQSRTQFLQNICQYKPKIDVNAKFCYYAEIIKTMIPNIIIFHNYDKRYIVKYTMSKNKVELMKKFIIDTSKNIDTDTTYQINQFHSKKLYGFYIFFIFFIF